MKDKVETIIQGKRFVARAVQQPDGKVAFHIYDFPDINTLPESRVTKLAHEFGLKDSRNFIWYGKVHFEKLYGEGHHARSVIAELTKDMPPHVRSNPFAHIARILDTHSLDVNPLDDDALKQIVEYTDQHIEKRTKEISLKGQSLSIVEQIYALNLLRRLLPNLLPNSTEKK